jgi:hypothetical protein
MVIFLNANPHSKNTAEEELTIKVILDWQEVFWVFKVVIYVRLTFSEYWRIYSI